MKKLLIVFIVLSACAPVYVPNLRNIPQFTSAGEFQGSFQFGNGIDLQGAVSLTKHVGIMGNFSYADRKDVEDPEQYHYHKFYEGGVGYFNNTDKLCYEVFAGYGWGEGAGYDKFEIFGSDNSVRGHGKFERFFIQPALGTNKRKMEVAFSTRISFVHMYRFSDELTDLNYSTNEDFVVFLEPTITGKLNMADRRLYMTFQTGASALLSQQRVWNHRPFQWGIGMGFRLGGMHNED